MDEKKLQKEKSTTKNTALNLVIILLLAIIIVSSVIGLYAWAKYTSAINGGAEAQVAKWNFNVGLKAGGNPVTLEEGPIDLVTTEYNHVASGKIAPGTSGEFDVIIDTSGTEVSLVYDVNISISNCPRNITFSKKGPGESNAVVISEGGPVNQNTFERTITLSKYVAVNPENQNGVFTEKIYWNWPYEADEGETTEEKAAYDKRDTDDQGKTVTMNITVTGTQVLQEQEQTSSIPVSSLTSTNYGQYVDIGTNILGKDNETEADWRVFYKDSTGGVWLTLSDYLPVDSGIGASIASSVGLQTEGTYGIYLDYDKEAYWEDGDYRNYVNYHARKDLIDKLNGDWSSLISGSDVAEKDGVEVKGAVDLETWVASWNEKYPNSETYPTNQIYTATITMEHLNDEVGYGYMVSRLNLPATPTTEQDIWARMEGSEGYIDESQADKLYFPHTSASGIDDCYAYWLASPSVSTGSDVVAVFWDSGVASSNWSHDYCGVRPVVYLPSNIKLDTSNTVWTIVNE